MGNCTTEMISILRKNYELLKSLGGWNLESVLAYVPIGMPKSIKLIEPYLDNLGVIKINKNQVKGPEQGVPLKIVVDKETGVVHRIVVGNDKGKVLIGEDDLSYLRHLGKIRPDDVSPEDRSKRIIPKKQEPSKRVIPQEQKGPIKIE
jgi:hypothetical protein